jgi:hypothetical protein
MRKEVLEELFNDAREGVCTEKGVTYETLDEWLSDNPNVKLELSDNVSDSLLDRAMLVIDDYLNAGCKTTRGLAAEKARLLYEAYYGIEYVNRNNR